MGSYKREFVAAGIGLLVGVLGTGLTVWRDVAVMQSELRHMQVDIDRINHFIGSDDPIVFKEAQRQIREDTDPH